MGHPLGPTRSIKLFDNWRGYGLAPRFSWSTLRSRIRYRPARCNDVSDRSSCRIFAVKQNIFLRSWVVNNSGSDNVAHNSTYVGPYNINLKYNVTVWSVTVIRKWHVLLSLSFNTSVGHKLSNRRIHVLVISLYLLGTVRYICRYSILILVLDIFMFLLLNIVSLQNRKLL